MTESSDVLLLEQSGLCVCVCLGENGVCESSDELKINSLWMMERSLLDVCVCVCVFSRCTETASGNPRRSPVSSTHCT